MRKVILSFYIFILIPAVNGQSYLPLSGGTLTGTLNGTSANFSLGVSASSFSGSGVGLTGTASGLSSRIYYDGSFGNGSLDLNSVYGFQSSRFYEYDGISSNPNTPVSNFYPYGTLLSFATTNSMLQILASEQASNNPSLGLIYRTGWAGNWHPYRTLLDNGNFQNFGLPVTGGTLTGNLSVGTSSNDVNLNLFKKIGSAGTADYKYVGQHSLPFQIFNTTSGIYNNRKIEMGVLDNGTAVLQASAAGEGYFPIHLNPVAGGVLIGNGNTMTTSYTLQVGGTSYFGGNSTFYGTNGCFTSKFGATVSGDSYVYLGSVSGIPSIQGNNNAFSSTQNLSLQNQGANLLIGTTTDNGGGAKVQVNGGLTTTGNVGIGTTNPSQLLSVAGNIQSKKLIVTQTGWSDYVFKPSYKLKPLSEVAAFIKTNKHLPEVPDANEVAKDGIDVGKTEALLLKKIEELTLYMIEMKKENEEMKKEITEIRKNQKSISALKN